MPEPDLESAISFAYALNLIILLAGLLIGPRSTWSFATLNGIFIFIVYFLFTKSLGETLKISFPPISVLYITATISWLYQRTLNKAHHQLLKVQLLQRDLEIARNVQQQLYPDPPDFAPNLKIAAHSEPALETSGDFYDFIPLNDREIGLIIADVGGKSISAAMIMTMTRSILRSEAQRHIAPARVLEGTNRVLYGDELINQMVTAFYGQLDAHLLTLRFSNAGHIYPILKRDGAIHEFDLPGFPLGIVGDPNYGEETIQLQPGDLLVLSSDGLIEAPDAAGDLFGFDRFSAVIQHSNGDRPEQLLQDIWAAVESYQAGTLQRDDMTLVVIKVEPGVKAGVEMLNGIEATYSPKTT